MAPSDEAGAVIAAVDFIKAQGYDLKGKLCEDNLGTISMVRNGASKSFRTKHIRVRNFWLKEIVESRELELVHVGTDLMIADVLTKTNARNKFKRMVSMLCNRVHE